MRGNPDIRSDSPSEILLVAPYEDYKSISRFVNCLERNLKPHAPVRVVRPKRVLGRFASGPMRKWFGYADQFLIAPRVLRRESAQSQMVHLTDQSLSIFAAHLRGRPHVLNCNDLIAVRARAGEFSEVQTGTMGRALQRRILDGVGAAAHVACISAATRRDVLRLSRRSQETTSVIPMGLHYPFQRLTDAEARPLTMGLIPDGPFLLHVGGNQWYKNRAGVLSIYRELLAALGNKPATPNLVLVGESLSPEHATFVRAHGLEKRVFVVTEASDHELRAIYSRARALIFPSIAEGFGWPIIEAQACGCPVVTTDRAPMTETGGMAAVYSDLEPGSFASKVRELLNENAAAVQKRMQSGFENAARFGAERMIQSYLELYRQVLEGLGSRRSMASGEMVPA